MPDNCAPRDGLNGKQEKALLKAPLSSAVYSGLLFKKGKIVRSWKQRKFVLDPTKGEVIYACNKHVLVCICTLSYSSMFFKPYNPQLSYLEDDRTQGSILIKDIISAEEAEPQQGEHLHSLTVSCIQSIQKICKLNLYIYHALRLITRGFMGTSE